MTTRVGAMCKHDKEIKRAPAKWQKELATPTKCKCGYSGCCEIDVYEHMLILGVSVFRKDKVHGFRRPRTKH